MAVVDFKFLGLNLSTIQNIIWANLSGSDTGNPFTLAAHSDKTVHVYGTYSGATLVLQGSNDPRANPDHPDHASADWQTLVDFLGSAISFTSNDIVQILDNTLYVRPVVVGGDGDTDLSVSVVGKKVK